MYEVLMPYVAQLTLQGNFQEVISVLGHVEFGLLQAGHRPAIMEVSLLDGNRQVVVNEMSGCGEVEIPLEGFQQEQLHMKQTLFGQDQIHGTHAAQTVQHLQLGHPVLPFLKFACNEGQNVTACTDRTATRLDYEVRSTLTGQKKT